MKRLTIAALIGMVVLLAIGAAQPCPAQQPAEYLAQLIFAAPWPAEYVVDKRSGSSTGQRTLYGQTASYRMVYMETGPAMGTASVTTSATQDDPCNSLCRYSSSQASVSFRINLAQPTVLNFVCRRSGTAEGCPSGNQLLPAGSHPFGLGSSSPTIQDEHVQFKSSVSLVWGPVGNLPGQSPTNPLSSGEGCRQTNECEGFRDEKYLDPDVILPAGITGTLELTTPVEGDYGRTAPIYFGGPPASAPTPPERAAIGYGFISQGLNITSVVLPGALPNGDSQFELLVGSEQHSVSAGSVFDFTSPDGVKGFALLGIDPSEGFDPTAAPPFPVGLQFAGEGVADLYTLTYSPIAHGDYDASFTLDAADLDMQAAAMHEPNPNLGTFDENGDGVVDSDDRVKWLHDLKNVYVGDADLNGEFNSSDFVQVFAAGEYETDELALWTEGDWDGNQVFDSGDFISAFVDGGYEQGPRTDAAAVPEPGAVVLLLVGLAGVMRRKRIAQDRS